MSFSVYGTGVPFAKYESGNIPPGISYSSGASGIRFSGVPTSCGRFVSYWTGPYPNPAIWRPISSVFSATNGSIEGQLVFNCASQGGCHEGVGHVTITRKGITIFDGNPPSGSKIVLPTKIRSTEFTQEDLFNLSVVYDGTGHCCDRAIFDAYSINLAGDSVKVGTFNLNNRGHYDGSNVICGHRFPPPVDFSITQNGGVWSGCPLYKSFVNNSIISWCTTKRFAVVFIIPTAGASCNFNDPLPDPNLVDFVAESELQLSPVSWGKAFRALREVPVAYAKRKSWATNRRVYIDYQQPGTSQTPFPVSPNTNSGILFRDESNALLTSTSLSAADYKADDWTILGATPNAEQTPENTLLTVGEATPTYTNFSYSSPSQLVSYDELRGLPLCDGVELVTPINFTIPVYAHSEMVSFNSEFYTPATEDAFGLKVFIIEEKDPDETGTEATKLVILKSVDLIDGGHLEYRNTPLSSQNESYLAPQRVESNGGEYRSFLIGIDVPARTKPSRVTIVASYYKK